MIDELGISAVFRCDSCQAQAFTAAVSDHGMLLLCGHHTKRHAPALRDSGWTIHDKTHLINEEPSVSANV